MLSTPCARARLSQLLDVQTYGLLTFEEAKELTVLSAEDNESTYVLQVLESGRFRALPAVVILKEENAGSARNLFACDPGAELEHLCEFDQEAAGDGAAPWSPSFFGGRAA